MSSVPPEAEEASFRLLFMNNPQPMWVYDLETLGLLEANEAASRHYGYSREEFLRMQITDLRPNDDVPRLMEDIVQVRDDWQYSGEWRHLLKNGRIIDVSIRSHTLQFRGRNAVLVVINDITQHKRSENALQEAERKYRHLFEKAIIGIFQSTPQGRFTSVNESLATMLGYDSPSDLIDNVLDIEQQFYVDSKRRHEFKRQLEEHNTLQSFEIEVYRKDRSKMWVSANVRAVRENGEIVSYEGSLEDVSQRKLLEEQFRQSQKMEAVGRLAGGVAHDFNNAIGVITGYSELLQLRLAPTDPLHKYADEIAKAGQRAASLTRQLLAFSRKQVIQPQVLDLNVIVGEMDKMLRRLIGEDIQITFSRSPRLAPIKADHGQIEQILMNLAVNARDAMPKGGKLFIHTENVVLDENLQPSARLCERRPLRNVELQRYRRRNGQADPGQNFRAFLHHQRSRQRHRTRVIDGLRNRQAEWRIHLGLQRSRQRRDFQNLFSPRRRCRTRHRKRGGSTPSAERALRPSSWSRTKIPYASLPAPASKPEATKSCLFPMPKSRWN